MSKNLRQKLGIKGMKIKQSSAELAGGEQVISVPPQARRARALWISRRPLAADSRRVSARSRTEILLHRERKQVPLRISSTKNERRKEKEERIRCVLPATNWNWKRIGATSTEAHRRSCRRSIAGGDSPPRWISARVSQPRSWSPDLDFSSFLFRDFPSSRKGILLSESWNEMRNSKSKGLKSLSLSLVSTRICKAWFPRERKRRDKENNWEREREREKRVCFTANRRFAVSSGAGPTCRYILQHVYVNDRTTSESVNNIDDSRFYARVANKEEI